MEIVPVSEVKKEILVVEDNPGDVEIMRRTFTKVGINLDCVVFCPTGMEGIEYLKREGKFEGRTSETKMIILDLQLPDIQGNNILAVLKTEPAYTGVPILIHSTVEDPEMIQACKGYEAANYLVKSTRNELQDEIAKTVKNHWDMALAA